MNEIQRPTRTQAKETKADILRTDKEVLVFLAGRVPQSALGAVLEISQPTVSKRLKQFGIPVTPCSSPRTQRLETHRRTIITMAREGVPAAEIAADLALAPRSVARVIARARAKRELSDTPRSKAGRRTPSESEDLRILVERTLLNGKTHQQTAEEFDITRPRVSQIVKIINRSRL